MAKTNSFPLSTVSLTSCFEAGMDGFVVNPMHDVQKHRFDPIYAYTPKDLKIKTRPSSTGKGDFAHGVWTKRPHSSMDSVRISDSFSEEAAKSHGSPVHYASRSQDSERKKYFNSMQSQMQSKVLNAEMLDAKPEPYLGPRLKKALMRHGLAKQNLSLETDEWDDDDVKLMLGSVFSSLEVSRALYIHFSPHL
jgi:hypothetical protein